MADKNPKPTAADKRQAADKALNARIEARRAASAKGALAKGGVAKAPEPVAEVPAAQIPFETTSTPPEAGKPEKKTRKPRTPKADATPDAELAELLKTAQDKAVKAAVKELESKHAAILKGTVDKTTHDRLVKEAYDKGVAEGKKQSLASLKAALKGGA